MKRLIVLASFVATACVSRAEIEEIKKGQKDILTKLDQIAKQGPARPVPQQPQGPDPMKTYALPVGDSPVKGPDDAWVTIVEISEFQCPFCKRVGPTLKEIEQKYGNDVRFVFKHNVLPFHNRAKPAAKAAECAREQGKFWQFHDITFDNQQALEDANLEEYAKKAGVDVGKWKSCYTSAKYEDRIDADQKLANGFGARGTPAFFINGRFLSGAQPTDNFVRIIDEELKKAKESGVSKRDYYKTKVEQQGQKNI